MTKHICVLPWMSIDRNVDTDVPHLAPCCWYEKQLPGELNNWDSYMKTDELVTLRREFKDGERPVGCRRCWYDEDNGKESMRQRVNEGRLQEYEQAINLSEELFAGIASQVKFGTGNNCNLSCRMCLPQLSSGVAKVWDAIGRPGLPDYGYDATADIYIRKNIHSLRYVDCLGGEPFYNKRFISLIDFMIDQNASKHITLFVNTNGTLITDTMIDKLKQFKEAVIMVSIDAIGKGYEYIRVGSSFNRVEDTVCRLKENGITVMIGSTYSVLSLCEQHELRTWCKTLDLPMTQGQTVHQPAELHPSNLPEKLYKYLFDDDLLDNFKSDVKIDCMPFIKQLDEHWGTDITKFMPYWKDVM